MKSSKIALENLTILTDLVKDYISENEKVKSLYNHFPTLENFEKQLNKKKFPKKNRVLLAETLKKQYEGVEETATVLKNIELLQKENTYTVTTAHQLCLFTGPLYFIYKIISAIKLAQQLKEKYPNYHFVPIYWMGSEDHDFEEINHTNIYGKKVEWDSMQRGAVGRMTNEGIQDAIKELSEILGENDAAKELISFLENTFKPTENYAFSFRKMIHHLFKEFGLVIVKQDDKAFKKVVQPILAKELTQGLVENSSRKTRKFLEENYHVQANPREINLFYLQENSRERIVREGRNYKVNNTSIEFSERELLSELEENPEKFSTNVVVRPLMQETILPNLAYIGGPGEMAYWLELKETFTDFEVEFPILILRDMAMILPKAIQKKMNSLGLSNSDIFKDKDFLIKEIVKEKTEENLSLGNEKKQLETLFSSIEAKGKSIDPTLEKSVASELQKSLNALNNLESKFLRAEKKNQEQTVGQIENIKSKLFPDNSLQERYDSFIPFYLKYGNDFFDELLNVFNPLENDFITLEE